LRHDGGLKRRALLTVALTSCLFLASLITASGHLTGGQIKIAGSYRVQFATFPSQPIPGSSITLAFSIQDLELHDVQNVTTSFVIIFGDKILHETPEEFRETGDFTYNYVFPYEGTYKLLLTISQGDEETRVEFSLAVHHEQPLPITLMITLLAVALFSVFLRVTWKRTHHKPDGRRFSGVVKAMCPQCKEVTRCLLHEAEDGLGKTSRTLVCTRCGTQTLEQT